MRLSRQQLKQKNCCLHYHQGILSLQNIKLKYKDTQSERQQKHGIAICRHQCFIVVPFWLNSDFDSLTNSLSPHIKYALSILFYGNNFIRTILQKIILRDEVAQSEWSKKFMFILFDLLYIIIFLKKS